MPRTAAVMLSEDILKERSSAYSQAYQAVSDAIESDVDNELVDSKFLHPLNRALDYLGKESGKMARQLKQVSRERQNAETAAAPTAPATNGTEKATAAASGAKS